MDNQPVISARITSFLHRYFGTRHSTCSTSKAPSAGNIVAKRLPDIRYADNPKIDNIVFICGLHRSGTTLLERLLVSKYNVSCLRSDATESEGQHMQNVYTPAIKFGGPGKFAFSHQMRQETDALSNHEECRFNLMSTWSQYVVGTSNVLIEKSPPNLTKIRWLRGVFPGSKFVIMLRDPRAVSGATQKWSNTSLPELMMHWNVAYGLARRAIDAQDCICIKYEDLCAETDATLEKVAAFVGLCKKASTSATDERFTELCNTNSKYFAMHEVEDYGLGEWDYFGYNPSHQD